MWSCCLCSLNTETSFNVACVADISFPFSKRGIVEASEQMSAPGVSKMRSGSLSIRLANWGWVLPQTPTTAPYFSHSLAVSFPSSAFRNEHLVHGVPFRGKHKPVPLSPAWFYQESSCYSLWILAADVVGQVHDLHHDWYGTATP